MGKHRRICTVDSCSKVVNGRGLCQRHYYLMKTYGSTDDRPKVTAEDRFWPRVHITADCWYWTGAINKDGYGCFGRSLKAHRFSYQSTFGYIPQRMVIDHICHNRRCVRPDHLRLATDKQNAENRRGLDVRNTSGYRGVSWNRAANRWQAYVQHNGVLMRLGHFSDVEEAAAVALKKRLELFTHNELDRTA